MTVRLLAILLASTALAEQNMIEYLTPRGGSRGTTVEVNFHGLQLKDPREALFYRTGIKAVNFQPKSPEDVKVRFEIAPDCPLGEHALRLRTATALSEVVTFWVSPFPQVTETEKKIGENDSPEKAQLVPLNSTVEGQILPGDAMDKDYYRIDVKQGQRISVEVEAVRLGTLHTGGDNDISVRILDANGKELGKSVRSAMYVEDPLLSIVAPEREAISSRSYSSSTLRHARRTTARISERSLGRRAFIQQVARPGPKSPLASWATLWASAPNRLRCRASLAISTTSPATIRRPRPTCCEFLRTRTCSKRRETDRLPYPRSRPR